jgi:hypothetical protein
MVFSLNRPYVRIKRDDFPPVFIQDGIPYGEGGQIVDPVPDWYQEELDKMNITARLEGGFDAPGIAENTELYHPYDRKMERRFIPPPPAGTDGPKHESAAAEAEAAPKDYPKPSNAPPPPPAAMGPLANDQPGRVTEPGQSGTGPDARDTVAPTFTDSTGGARAAAQAQAAATEEDEPRTTSGRSRKAKTRSSPVDETATTPYGSSEVTHDDNLEEDT